MSRDIVVTTNSIMLFRGKCQNEMKLTRKRLSFSVPILPTHLLKRTKPKQNKKKKKNTNACSKIQKYSLVENMATELGERDYIWLVKVSSMPTFLIVVENMIWKSS